MLEGKWTILAGWERWRAELVQSLAFATSAATVSSCQPQLAHAHCNYLPTWPA